MACHFLVHGRGSKNPSQSLVPFIKVRMSLWQVAHGCALLIWFIKIICCILRDRNLHQCPSTKMLISKKLFHNSPFAVWCLNFFCEPSMLRGFFRLSWLLDWAQSYEPIFCFVYIFFSLFIPNDFSSSCILRDISYGNKGSPTVHSSWACLVVCISLEPRFLPYCVSSGS